MFCGTAAPLAHPSVNKTRLEALRSPLRHLIAGFRAQLGEIQLHKAN